MNNKFLTARSVMDVIFVEYSHHINYCNDNCDCRFIQLFKMYKRNRDETITTVFGYKK